MSNEVSVVRFIPTLLNLNNEKIETEATLSYTSSNPLEVVMSVTTFDDKDFKIVFARELLLYGCATTTGIGDIQVSSQDGLTEVSLMVTEPTMRVTFDTYDVVEFVNETSKVVKFGFESIQVPDDLSTLF